jgi:deoxycytidylate deaminase
MVPDDMTEVLAIGYNGPPSGVPNESCRAEEGACGCIHAEANALVKLRARARRITLITGVAPCEHCAGLILNSKRVAAVVFDGFYRDSRGINLLSSRGVLVVNSRDYGVTPLPSSQGNLPLPPTPLPGKVGGGESGE